MTTDQTPKSVQPPITQRNKPPKPNYHQESAGALEVSQASLVNSECTDLLRNDLASKFLSKQQKGAIDNTYKLTIATAAPLRPQRKNPSTPTPQQKSKVESDFISESSQVHDAKRTKHTDLWTAIYLKQQKGAMYE